MAARVTASIPAGLRLRLAVPLCAILLGLLVLGVLRGTSSDVAPPASPLTFSSSTIVIAEFGRSVDTVWRVDPQRPELRQRLLTAPHAADYGIIGSLSPDGKLLAFNALPRDTRSPTVQTPAELWLANLEDGSPATLLTRHVDLLVKPVWSADAAALVVRQTAPEGTTALVLLDVATAARRELVSDAGALFPIGFSRDLALLYYARLSLAGSDLFRVPVTASSEPVLLAHLSDGLTRDWSLSPDGGRIAYLNLSQRGSDVISRAYQADVVSRLVQSLTESSGSEFAPVWSSRDAAVGRLPEGAAAGVSLTSQTQALAAPSRGFDVPLAFDASDDLLAVRSFDGLSVSEPGAASLVLVARDGRRIPISDKEVTFLGWINR